MTAREAALEAALRALLDGLKWEDELMAWVMTTDGRIGQARDVLNAIPLREPDALKESR
jgi:hypothetical protein